MNREQKFWNRWMLIYSFGEILGIGAAATIGRFLFIGFSSTSIAQSSALFFFILVMSGAAEGIIIGYVQWKSLSKLLVNFHPVIWIITTSLAAITGWLLILPPSVVFISFFSTLKLINAYYSLLYAAFAGMAFGGIIGITQYFIIKQFYNKAYVWIMANALGWMHSFITIYLALLLLSHFTSIILNFIIIFLSSSLSGLIQGILTGSALHFSMRIKGTHKIELIRQRNRFLIHH